MYSFQILVDLYSTCLSLRMWDLGDLVPRVAPSTAHRRMMATSISPRACLLAWGLVGGVLLPVPHSCLVVNSPSNSSCRKLNFCPCLSAHAACCLFPIGEWQLRPSRGLDQTLRLRSFWCSHIFPSRRPTQLYLDICPESARSHTLYSSPWPEPSNVSGLHLYSSLPTGLPASAPVKLDSFLSFLAG